MSVVLDDVERAVVVVVVGDMAEDVVDELGVLVVAGAVLDDS